MLEWINVKDQMPEPFVNILAAYDSGEVTKDLFLKSEGRFLFEGLSVYGKVTHWMPLPKNPNEIKEGNENE